MVPLCSVFGFYGNTEQVCHFEYCGEVWLLAFANIGVSDTEAHT